MVDFVKEIKEDLDRLDNIHLRYNGNPLLSRANTDAFVKEITELADNIATIDEFSHDQLTEISKYICKDWLADGPYAGNFIVNNYFRGALQSIVDFIDSDSFRCKFKTKKPKIFISHSTDDKQYVGKFVQMLEKSAVKPEHLFCSSVQGYGIPLNENIYDYLRSEFEQYDLYVIFMLSKNYYKSKACLNEMGAAWGLQTEYQAILLPGFHYKQFEGAINPRKICFQLNNIGERESRLTELKDRIISKLELPDLGQTIWERHRKAFLDEIDTFSKSAP